MDAELREALRDGDTVKAARLHMRAGQLDEAFDLLGPAWREGDLQAGELLLEGLRNLEHQERCQHAGRLDRLAVEAGIVAARAAWLEWFPAAARFLGRSDELVVIREFLCRKAHAPEPLGIVAEMGSGRSTAARILHDLSAREGFQELEVLDEEALAAEVETQAPAAGTLHVQLWFPSQLSWEPILTTCRRSGTRLIISVPLHMPQPFRWDEAWGPLEGCRLPPLRERVEDFSLLIDHFLKELGRPDLEISDDVWETLDCYSWQRNLAELREVLEQAVAHVGEGTILDDPLADWIPEDP